MTNEIQRFSALLQSSDTLIEQATKEDVAEVTRVLALMLLTIERGTGMCPMKNRLKMLRTERISDEQAKTLADRFGVLVEVLLKALATPESL